MADAGFTSGKLAKPAFGWNFSMLRLATGGKPSALAA